MTLRRKSRLVQENAVTNQSGSLRFRNRSNHKGPFCDEEFYAEGQLIKCQKKTEARNETQSKRGQIINCQKNRHKM
jgi:hypothetical protein